MWCTSCYSQFATYVQRGGLPVSGLLVTVEGIRVFEAHIHVTWVKWSLTVEDSLLLPAYQYECRRNCRVRLP